MEPVTGNNISLNTTINGMYTYLRFLFTANTIIILNEKSYDAVQIHYSTERDCSVSLSNKIYLSIVYNRHA